MTSNKPFTTLAAVIFLVMALLHAYRLVTHFQITVGSHTVPDWVSWVGIIVPAILAWGLWKESKS